MRVGVAFPWSGIVARDHGSAQRIGLLVDFLRDNGDEVRVLSPGLGPDDSRGNVSYAYHQPTEREDARDKRSRAAFRRLMTALTRRSWDPDEDLWFWRHWEPRLQPSLGRTLAALVDWSDVILVSFSFWARPLARLAHQKGIAVVATPHDHIAGQVRSSRLLRWLTRRAEIGALRTADHCFASSAQDRAAFAAHGLRTEILLPGVDLGRAAHPSDAAERARLRARLALADGDRVCVFIGAVHPPNYAAVTAVRVMAHALADRGRRDVRFVVAGAVTPPEEDGTFTALGHVDQPVLDELHRMADLALIPLAAGTGISRKTLEALAFGKPTLATSIGFRGLPVESGTHGVVCDDLGAYPSRILDILGDADLRRRLAAGAREVAAHYDYRRVYRRYLDVIAAGRAAAVTER